ncbi:MAG: phosphatase PAP2 family protein [Pirellulales bacterium]|nr:phosphatase PAP2 family protein [Pirellulales bacterium]
MATRHLELILWLARHQLGLLLSLLAIAVAGWVFLEIADEVIEGDTKAADEAIILWLREPGNPHDPIGPHWMAEFARDITALGGTGVLVLVTAAVAGYLWLDRRFGALWLVVLATLSGTALAYGLKSTFNRPRPELVPHLAETFTSSFPSGHSMLSAVVYLTLGALLAQLARAKRLKAYVLSVAVLLTGLVGFTRVYLGVHYPTDVVAGWSAGLFWAVVCLLIARYLQRRGAVEEPE